MAKSNGVIKKRESELKSALKLEVRKRLPGAVLLSHEDVRSVGIPDWSLTWRGRTSWWEFKHATPKFQSLGRQELMMQRLEGAGRAYYVVWHELPSQVNNTMYAGVKRTFIVAPRHIKEDITKSYVEFAGGFDHVFVVEFMRGVHGAD